MHCQEMHKEMSHLMEYYMENIMNAECGANLVPTSENKDKVPIIQAKYVI